MQEAIYTLDRTHTESRVVGELTSTNKWTTLS
jgi:hypothetical protein